MNRHLPRLLTALTALTLLPATAVTSAAHADDGSDGAAGITEQWRGYWVDGFKPGIYDRAEVKELVKDAEDLGTNVLVVQIGRRFDCFCNKAMYPRTDAGIAPKPYDPLAHLLKRAHSAGIEVHAWVNATTLWNSATPPTSPEHAYNAHGPDATGRDRWLNKNVDGEEIIGDNSYADPANPDAVDYIVDAVASITENYDVDGINLDYIRYPDNLAEFRNDWGYSQTSLERFWLETGRDDTPEPTDEEFSQWRRDQVSNLVRKVYLRMYEVDRRNRLSINGITYGYGPATHGSWEQTRPYLNVMQDWKGWLEEGIVDTVTAMNYKREWMNDQARMFEEWNEALAGYRGDRHAVSGAALYLNAIEDSVRQAKAVTALGLDGWMGYAYANASLTAAGSEDPEVKEKERSALADAMRAKVFTDKARVPEMPWKDAPRTGHISGTVVADDRDASDQLDILLEPIGSTPGHEQVVRTDGSGWFGVVDLEPGEYRASVIEPGSPEAVAEVVVEKGRVSPLELDLTSA